MPNPRLHLTHEIRRAVGIVGSEPTIMGGNALAKTGVHALDGPEHTPPTLGGDLQGAGATLEVRALQGVALGDLSGIADGDTLVYQAASSSLLPAPAGTTVPGVITAGWSGGGSALTAGATFAVACPSSGTITSWRIVADDAATTATVYVKEGAANPPSGSITGGADPSISGATDASSSSLGAWTTALTAGHVLLFTLHAVTHATWLSITLTYTRS